MPGVHAKRRKNDVEILDVVKFYGTVCARGVHHEASADAAMGFRIVPDLCGGNAVVQQFTMRGGDNIAGPACGRAEHVARELR